ncbi:MAG: isopeptide-forming domain-containing fimbrial protein, partial [Desulfobacterales bacterium]|nr:isopeptide-forming domain-containing fimbrial protein [Desulfobacterales bacterium]
ANIVTVGGNNFSDVSSGATASVIVGSDLSTSTKGVVDVNGGDAEPGDILRYTLTLIETAGHDAASVSVSDEIPADVTDFTVISVPPGATDSSTGAGSGANGTGRLQVADISVAAGGSVEVVFDVTIAATVPDGTAIDNTAVITNPNGLGASPHAPTVIVTVPLVSPDLSTSTKGVVDVNGGDAEPGDVLRYTLTLIETAGFDAASVSVSDEIPADVTDFTVISVPPGATDSSTGAGSGANGTGWLQVADISVAAGGSVVIVFEVTIAAGTPDGTSIDNTAVITNPGGMGASPSALSVIVTQSSNPASGNKPLYFYSAGRSLNRTPPPTSEPRVRINGGNSDSWVLTPALASNLIVSGDAGEIPVQLWLRSRSSSDVTVSLSLSPVSDTLTIGSSWALHTFRIPVSGDVTLSVGDSITLTIQNNSSDRVRFDPYNSGEYSKVDLEAKTVINVDNVNFYDAAYPLGNLITSVVPGQNIYIRSMVSDPFGSYDISSASLFLTTPTGTVVVNNAAMTEVAADANGPFKTFEYLYPDPPDTWPAGFVDGIWTARVTAEEGTEGLVRDTGVGTFRVASPPDIVMLKSVSTESDPVNGGVNPMAIPGALMLYTVTVTNTGGSGADSDSIEVTDAIPGDVKLYVGNPILPGGPVIFNDGMPSSGLSYDFNSDIAFYANSDCTGVRSLWPDADGCDDAVRCMRVNPKGIFNGNGGTFTLQFRVRVH